MLFFDLPANAQRARLLRELRSERLTLAYSKPLAMGHKSAGARSNHAGIVRNARRFIALRCSTLRNIAPAKLP